MAVFFDRPAFKAGVMILDYELANGDAAELYLTALDQGRELTEIPPSKENQFKNIHKGWVHNSAELNAKRNARATAKANNGKRVF